MPNWFSNLFSKKSYPFGTSGRYSEDFSNLSKWTNMLNRHKQDMNQQGGTVADNPKFGQWLHFIDSIKTKDPLEKLHLVNNWTNTTAYISDAKNWKQSDYWATPNEFLAKGGDCEDYASAKYLTLRMLGFAIPDLRLVVLDDQQKRTTHAVLVVYEGVKAHMLDNQIKQVVTPNTVSHYKPLYSLNEKGWWTL